MGDSDIFQHQSTARVPQETLYETCARCKVAMWLWLCWLWQPEVLIGVMVDMVGFGFVTSVLEHININVGWA